MNEANEHTDIDQWEDYWRSKTLKRTIIEYVRKIYFAKYFAKRVMRYFEAGLILEAGCGTGEIAKLMMNVNRGIVCIDKSYKILKAAKNKCRLCVAADIFNLPFKNNSFSGAYNQGVMEHFNIKDFKKATDEIKRTTEKIVVIVPCRTSIFRWIYNPFSEVNNQEVFWSKNRLAQYLKQSYSHVETKYLPGSFFISMIGYGRTS